MNSTTTRKLAFCMAAFALASSAAWATIEAKAIPSVPYDGAMTPVIADKTDGEFATAPTLWYKVSTASGAYTDQTMKPTANGRYVGYLPAVGGATTFNFYVTDGVDTSTPTPDSVAVGSSIDYNRFHDGIAYNASTAPYGWQINFESNCYAQTPKYLITGSNADLWLANGIGNRTSAVMTGARALGGDIDESIGMAYPVAAFQNLPPSAMPYIRSPKLEGGVGTIDFRSVFVTPTESGAPTRNIRTSEVTLQVAYTDEEPVETNWVTVAVYKYGTSNGGVFPRINHEVLNDPDVTFVRIFRTGYNEDAPTTPASGRLAIDNICITKPPADVGIVHKLENPGYPSQGSNVLIRCSVTNVVDATPATNRQVTCFYQYVPKSDDAPEASKWLSTPMAYRGATNGMDWYEGTIGGTNTGYVWYYYQVDYDGYCYGVNPDTTSAAYGSHESLTPTYWMTDASGENSIHSKPTSVGRYQVRPYPSRYSRVAFAPVDTTIFSNMGNNDSLTLVDVERWQIVVPVGGYTVISNYFCGYGYYADDADDYSSDVVYWGDNDPDAISDPTIAGFLEKNIDQGAVSRVVALNEKKYNGFYLYRFSTDDDAGVFDYLIKKAVYQDFDDWTATPDYYESSLGGLPTTTYAENFDGNSVEAASGSVVSTNKWSLDGYGDADSTQYARETFQFDETSEAWEASGIETGLGFYRTGTRVLTDRLIGTTAAANMSLAMRLDGQIENLGTPAPTSTRIPTITYGLEKIAFKARASVSDDNFALYKDGTGWTLASGSNNNGPSMYISTTWYFENVSPSKPYFSYILFYKPADSYLAEEEPATWYELRIVKSDSSADDNTAIFQLWHRDSTGRNDREVATQTLAQRTKSGALYKFLSNAPKSINLRLKNNGNKLHVNVNVDSGNPDSAHVSLTSNYDDPTIASVGGTIGFGVFDAVPVISKVTVGSSNGGTQLLNTPITEANWSHGGKRANGTVYRWTFPTVGSATVITREVPDQTIGIYVGDVVGDEERVMIDSLKNATVFTTNVSSLAFSDVTLPIHSWARKFVTLRYVDGDGGVVIDDVNLSPWRAFTRYEGDSLHAGGLADGYLDWKTQSEQDAWLESTISTLPFDSMFDHWAVLEGVVKNAGAFQIGAEFTRSRANPALAQGVVSPEMTNHIGSISFSYSVGGEAGQHVAYAVEYTEEDDYTTWITKAVYTNAVGETGSRYEKIGKYYPGRVRVRILGDGTDPDATIVIDNLRTKDYPDNNGNAWVAYNLLITEGNSTNMNLVAGRTLVDSGLIYNNNGKSCFLNNSQTNGTYGTEVYGEDNPYLQTPPLTGVGVGEITFRYRLVPEADGTVRDGEINIVIGTEYEGEPGKRGDGEWKALTNITLSATADEGSIFVPFSNDKIFEEDYFVVRFYNSTNTATRSRVVIDDVLVTAPARPSFEFEYVTLAPIQPLAGSNTTVEAKIMRQILNPQGIRIFCSWHTYSEGETWGYKNWLDPNDASCRVELAKVGDSHVYRAEGGIPGTNDIDDIVEYVVWGRHAEIDIEHGDPPIVQGLETFENPEWYKTFNASSMTMSDLDMNADHVQEGWSPYYWVYSCAPGTFFVNEINNWYSSSATADRGTEEYVEFAAPAGTDIGGWRFAMVGGMSGSTSSSVGSARGKDAYTVAEGTTIPHDTGNGWGFFVWGDEWMDNEDAAFTDSATTAKENIGTYAGILVYRSNNAIEQMVSFGTERYVSGSGWEDFTYAGRKVNRLADSLSLLSRSDSETGEQIAGSTVDDFYWYTGAHTPGAVNGVAQVFDDLPYDEPVGSRFFAPSGVEVTNANVLAWIRNNSYTQSDINALGDNAAADSEFNTRYLLNQDLKARSCTHSLNITSVSVDGTSMHATATLTRTEDGDDVESGRGINGRLVLEGADTLSDGFYQLDPTAREVETVDPTSGDANEDFSHSNDVDIHFLRLRIIE